MSKGEYICSPDRETLFNCSVIEKNQLSANLHKQSIIYHMNNEGISSIPKCRTCLNQVCLPFTSLFCESCLAAKIIAKQNESRGTEVYCRFKTFDKNSKDLSGEQDYIFTLKNGKLIFILNGVRVVIDDFKVLWRKNNFPLIEINEPIKYNLTQTAKGMIKGYFASRFLCENILAGKICKSLKVFQVNEINCSVFPRGYTGWQISGSNIKIHLTCRSCYFVEQEINKANRAANMESDKMILQLTKENINLKNKLDKSIYA